MKKTAIILSILALTVSVFAQQENDYLLKYDDDDCLCFGYKNEKGEIVIPAKYFAAEDTLHTTAFVYEDKDWKLIDRNENTLLFPFIYDNGPDYIVEGVFRFVENEKMGFATHEGKIVIPARFDFVMPFENGIAEYHIGGYREYLPDGEHWYWTGSKETGYINCAGERVSFPQQTEK
jgi:hypothetical protein